MFVNVTLRAKEMFLQSLHLDSGACNPQQELLFLSGAKKKKNPKPKSTQDRLQSTSCNTNSGLLVGAMGKSWALLDTLLAPSYTLIFSPVHRKSQITSSKMKQEAEEVHSDIWRETERRDKYL